MKSTLRNVARSTFSTPNTIRYLIEWERIRTALESCPVRGGTLLDAGAGSGEYSRRILRAGLVDEVVALEPFAGNYRMLVNNLAPYGRSVTTIQSGIESIPREDASVDFLLCTQVLEHIEEHEKVAAEFGRVVRPGGYSIITVPRPPEPWPENDHVREGYVEAELQALMEIGGFEALSWDWFFTKQTQDRFKRVTSLPLRGVWFPLPLFRAEMRLSGEERRARQPYGLLGVFRKR